MSIRGLKVTRYLQQRAEHQPLHARLLSCEATPRTSHRGRDGLLLANLTPHKGGRLLGQAFKTFPALQAPQKRHPVQRAHSRYRAEALWHTPLRPARPSSGLQGSP